jgi:hypothetical protein
MNKVNKTNYIDYIMDYEQGELTDLKTLDLFSFLIKDKICWNLQGHYGRTAKNLINEGWISPKGFINEELIETHQL